MVDVSLTCSRWLLEKKERKTTCNVWPRYDIVYNMTNEVMLKHKDFEGFAKASVQEF